MTRLIIPLLVAVLVVGAVGTAAATEGSPDLTVHLPDNRVSPGEETTLDVFVLNGGDVDEGGPMSEVTRVTTARGVTVELTAGNAPVEIRTGTQPVGNVPEGRVGPIQFAISVDESAEPGQYEVPVTVSYRYTSQTGSRSSSGTVLSPHRSDEETVERTITLVVEEQARFAAVSATTDAVVGESGDVSLTFENVGAAAASSARVTLESADGVLTFDGSRTAQVFVGGWAPGEQRTVTVTGQFAGGGGARSVPVSATVAFEDDGDPRVSDRIEVGITPLPEPSFTLADVTSTLAIGDEGTLEGRVTNTGETRIRNAVVIFADEHPNVVPVETEYAIGDLDPGESAMFAFDAEVSDSANAGPRQLTFEVRYRNGNDDLRRSDPLDVRVEVGARRNVFAVEPLSATFGAGEAGVLELRITNAGDEPVTDVSAKLFADDPLSSSDDEAFIDRLGPGESSTVRFGLTAGSDALRKVYPVSLDFQYDDADGDSRLSDTYDVPVEVSGSQNGGSLPVAGIGGAVVVVVALLVGGRWYWRRR